MRKETRKILGVLLILGTLAGRPIETFAFYIPVEPSLRGIGNANVQAIEADLRTLEQAVLLFRMDNHSGANLSENVNNIDVLAGYTDVPSRFGDAGSYGFFIDSRGWWVGAAVQDANVMSSSAANAAGGHGWVGSANTMTPPGNATFTTSDGAVWKLLR